MAVIAVGVASAAVLAINLLLDNSGDSFQQSLRGAMHDAEAFIF